MSKLTHLDALAHTRRGFLKSVGLATAALAGSNFVVATPGWAAAKTGMKSSSAQGDVAILNVALGLEQQAIAAYQVGAESGLLQKPVLDVAVKFQSHHKAHAGVLEKAIQSMGGRPVEAKTVADYGFPTQTLKTQADVLRFAAGLEKGAALAYLGAVPQFHSPDLSKAAASILGDETMHWSVLLNALGEDPVPVAFIG